MISFHVFAGKNFPGVLDDHRFGALSIPNVALNSTKRRGSGYPPSVKRTLDLWHHVLEHSNVCAGIPELPGITQNYPELAGTGSS